MYLDAFPATAAFITKRGGTLEQTKDLFQDALIIYYEQVLTVGSEIRVSEKAYLLGIVKHLWYGQIREASDSERLDNIDTSLLTETKEPVMSNHKLLSFLESAGERCMEMLKAFYYDKCSLAKIAERFGFSGTRSATVQKYKCLERVREEVKERKLEYADFTE
ncbi:MAG: hypothetical protein Roseis2KO_37760 [Roseivirga sp.]